MLQSSWLRDLANLAYARSAAGARLQRACFHLQPAPGMQHRRLSADSKAVELLALTDLAAGQEATISYTGTARVWYQYTAAFVLPCTTPVARMRWHSWDGEDDTHVCMRPVPHAGLQGLTNQRLMAQYGFVLQGGNTADRLQFAALDPGAPTAGTSSSSGSNGSGPGRDGWGEVLLSLDRMQASMGSNEGMALAMSGRDPYAYAALKSLPFAAEEGAAAQLPQQLGLAAALQAELAAEAAAWPTSLAEDSALAASWQQQAGAASAGGSADPRLVAAVQYRMQRKSLVRTCSGLLAEFAAGPKAPS